MTGVVTALGTMAVIAVVGWLLARTGTLGAGAERALARVVFVVAGPSLILVTVAHADLGQLLSRLAVVTAASTALVAVVAAVVLRVAWRRPAGQATVGTLAASYVNAGNLGIPIAVFVLGDAVAVVPTLLFQLAVLAPLAFLVLEQRTDGNLAAGAPAGSPGAGMPRDPADAAPAPPSRGAAVRAAAARTARTPILIGAAVGIVLALLPWDLPEVVYEPFRLVGAAAAPLALLAFGMSLAVPRTPADERPVRDLALAVVLRSVVHPALAAGIGLALGLDRPALLAVVTMAALPTAQNVLVYALQYGRGVALARDAGLLTTALALPVMLLIAALLG